MNEQYGYMFDQEPIVLGRVTSSTWRKDPKRLSFVLSRYKFCAKILEGCSNVFEVGCGDGWAAKIVSECVDHLTLTDYDPRFCEEASFSSSSWPRIPSVLCHDFLATTMEHIAWMFLNIYHRHKSVLSYQI